MSSVYAHASSDSPPSPSSRWLKINLSILGSFILLIGGFHLIQLLFNEIMMLVGAYNFTFIILCWVLFVDALLNIAIKAICQIFKKPTFKVSRHVSVVIAYACIIFFFFVFVVTILPSLSIQLNELQHFIPKAFHRVEGLLWQLQKDLDFTLPHVITDQLHLLKSHLVGGLYTLGSKSITPFFYILMGQLISLYLLVDGAKITKLVTVFLPNSRNNRLARGVVLSQVLMFRTVKAYAVIALVSGVFMYVVFQSLGLSYAGLLAFIYAILCFIPVLGPWLGLLLPALILMAQLALTKLLILGLIAGVFHILRAKYLSPHLFDKRYYVHPLILMFILLISVDVAGLWGVLFILPLAVIVASTKRLFFLSPVKRRLPLVRPPFKKDDFSDF
ncbi:MAG: AI-2E family transporter [Vampirovibrionales bacterium]